MTRAKIIDGELHAHHPQWAHDLGHLGRVLDSHALRDLQLQAVRVKTRPLQDVHHRIGQVAALKLARRDVHSHRNVEAFLHPYAR